MSRGSPTTINTDDAFDLRTGTRADAAALRALYRRSASTNDSGRRAFAARPELTEPTDEHLDAGRVRVAREGARILGFAVTVTTEDGTTEDRTAELDALFVEPEAMGRGIGRALVDDAAAVALGAGVQQLDVVAASEAVPFYRRCGFEGRGPTSTEFGPAELMTRRLGQ